ncbi:hypothetical protein [Mucilaginibacter jinjuensis]|uniref:Uncharacterized protein n=1 Tax=Mucilaginibacter jinjuensis TaxID=1176721 RepID=A0ABY7TDY7_9SPHI|nr:hypothetical protein [Mucilaginibacter jinjuensis]WCT14730.1 hypothetical protein PQO05_12365 [Mucilaginibacter jinjuensis]
MFKSLFIAASFIACGALAKAQSLNSYKLAPLDNSKTLSNQLPQFKIDTSFTYKLPQTVPYTQFMPVQPLQKDYSEFLTADNFNSNMPVVKLQSTDKMPVLKLGDSETTHYTMLIKRIGSEATNDKPRP